MYRMDRHDVPACPPCVASTDELLAWCEAHVLRVHTKWGTFPPLDRWGFLGRRLHSAVLNLGSSFKTATANVRLFPERVLRRRLRWPREPGARGLILTGLHVLTRLARLSQLAGLYAYARAVRRCRAVFRPLWLIQGGLRLASQYLSPLPKVHTNGCGDFTLLSRDAWFRLRAYPELPIWSMHIDSLLCYMAVASGITEEVLRSPKRVYHLEHENSWVVLTPDDRLRTFVTKPWLDLGLLAELWSQMYCTGQPVSFNSPDWGLAERSLDEVWIEGGEKRMVKCRSAEWAATGS
jgi:hypothetical protein